MVNTSLPFGWNTDFILDQIDNYGFCVIDQVYDSDFFTALNTECLQHLNEFRAAGIQNGVVSHIRSDHILWLDDTQVLAKQHRENLLALGKVFNQAFFMGINQVEAHFARYGVGEAYALHRDNPQQKNDRIISTVFYMHDIWQDDWGGELRLQDKQDHWHVIIPKPNRMVVFDSNLLHEVQVSKQQRLSITAWLRHDNEVW
ncbi:2OG-Fe(II) oxygenase [Acinetobacter rathckeae]|uniref:2OG-Fe(II) oxygenase n=1 Tax=Acinetobacter rathckeae TaxID=2605272 RepID=UPI0018A2BBF2|nr:2OG-Fe(II) oxygenase [Acinetobacter rathckeae]MBF7688525.1 2OG-Fe(II) oxygenase [Acinetobacter rathckeae]MBF7695609.1 2OG-Fe(II) oxygenase [Acinetobacter rathckeae]